MIWFIWFSFETYGDSGISHSMNPPNFMLDGHLDEGQQLLLTRKLGSSLGRQVQAGAMVAGASPPVSSNVAGWKSTRNADL